MEQEKVYLIPENLLKAVVNYLVTRPYNEVHQAVPALAQLKVLPPPTEDKK
jgi:hypothetical protein